MQGAEFLSIQRALITLQQEGLSERRKAAAIKFEEKCEKYPKHADMFPRNSPKTLMAF